MSHTIPVDPPKRWYVAPADAESAVVKSADGEIEGAVLIVNVDYKKAYVESDSDTHKHIEPPYTIAPGTEVLRFFGRYDKNFQGDRDEDDLSDGILKSRIEIERLAGMACYFTVTDNDYVINHVTYKVMITFTPVDKSTEREVDGVVATFYGNHKLINGTGEGKWEYGRKADAKGHNTGSGK